MWEVIAYATAGYFTACALLIKFLRGCKGPTLVERDGEWPQPELEQVSVSTIEDLEAYDQRIRDEMRLPSRRRDNLTDSLIAHNNALQAENEQLRRAANAKPPGWGHS